MLRTTITCDNRDRDGGPCETTALVHSITYIYDRDRPALGDPVIEVEYEVECPNCGRRRQVVGPDDSSA